MKEYFPQNKLFEKLAAIEHERWADWQIYCFNKLEIKRPNHIDFPCGINEDDTTRWWRQIETPYNELSENEKDSDREQVMRYWYLINPSSKSEE